LFLLPDFKNQTLLHYIFSANPRPRKKFRSTLEKPRQVGISMRSPWYNQTR